MALDQLNLLDWKPPEPFIAKGSTFNQARDSKRLGDQCQRVFTAMRSGEWQTLESLGQITGDPQASISARLRDLRRHGFRIDREYVARGLWKYRLVA